MKYRRTRPMPRFAALSAGIAVALASTAAAAQDATGEEEQATTLDRIEVTGSRIKRVDVETSQPIFSLSRDDIQAQGLTSVGDVIQNLTTGGTTLNTTINNGGNGETRVSMRNLGSNRTLVLVNGRRWVGGNGMGGEVDLNTLPTAAVERIEVLKDGASTIYGSDAIAGVVNVILRKDFDGAEANAYYGQFDKGDGARQSYDFTVGNTGDRWRAMFGIGYVKEDPVRSGAREISSVPVAGTGNFAGSSNTPNGVFALGDPALGNAGKRLPDGSPGLFTYDPGDFGEDWRPYSSADAYNFAPEMYLLTPQERISLFANGGLDINDSIRFRVTSQFNERKSEQLLASMPIALGTGPNAGANGSTIYISADSFYNPFGEDITSIARRSSETGGRSFNQEVDTFVFDGGFEGSFQLGERYFDWEAGYFYGKNERVDSDRGTFSLIALRQGLGPSFMDTDGVVKCGRPGEVIAGCVPINLLGLGSLTPEMLAYATITTHDQFLYEQKRYYADISGDLFSLPGGQMAFAAGLESRKEFGFDQPDALVASDQTTSSARLPTRGGYSVDEAYLELSIPVLADAPFARLLDFNLATRYSDYSTFGDTSNSKFGFRWKPIEDLMIRGNWSEGFRAPAIGELFAGQADSFPQLLDPCANAPQGNRYAGLTPEQQANCHAAGVPVGGYSQGNPQLRITVGGNPDLLPEISTSKTLGFVYSPSWIDGLDVSLDWWRIGIEDTVTAFSGTQIVNKCIIEGIQSFCDLITRRSDGYISDLQANLVNVGFTNVEGYDMTVRYRLPEQSWGRLSLVSDTTYMSLVEVDLDGDGLITEADGGNLVGEYFLGSTGSNNWRIRSNLQARWERGDWHATWVTRFYSRQDAPCILAATPFEDLCTDPDRETEDGPAPEHKMPSTVYHDAAIGWSAPWNATITVGINNLFDKDPPITYDSNASGRSFNSQYEVPGRFPYIRYTQKF